jgi:hypothetical protein
VLRNRQNAILGFVLDPKIEKANSTLEFLVVLPKVDEVAPERDFVLGNPGTILPVSMFIRTTCKGKLKIPSWTGNCVSQSVNSDASNPVAIEKDGIALQGKPNERRFSYPGIDPEREQWNSTCN